MSITKEDFLFKGRLVAGTENKVGAKATTLANTEASTAKVN